MNNGIVKKISILAATVLLGACGSMTPTADAGKPILSAAEAQAQIQVTIRPLAPIADAETIVAAND